MPFPHSFQSKSSPSRPLRPGAIHRTGLIIAAGFAVTLAVTLVLIARNSTNASLKNLSTQPALKPTAPNLSNVPALTASQGGLTQGEKFFMQFADRADPTRIAGEVTADTSQPLPERRYQLTKPAAWFFTTDGRSVYVEADEGQMRVASEATRASAPKSTTGVMGGGSGGVETGTLVGNVYIRVYESTPDGSRPDITKAKPFATLRTSRISVDWLLGQMEIPESFAATWQTLDYTGQGAVVQFDAATRIIDSIAIATTKEIRIRPEESASTSTRPTTPTTATTPSNTKTQIALATQSPKPTTTTTPAPAETDLAPNVDNYYSINTPSTLTVTQGEGISLVAASLQAYAHLIDGKLARTTSDEPTSTSSPQSAASQPPPTNQSQRPASQNSSTPTTTTSTPPPTSAQPKPTRVLLSGPIEVRRILKAPQELTRDAWWATLQSSESQRITATDATRGLLLLADTAEVAGSRQLVTLNATNAAPLTIQSADAGDLSARTLELDQRTNIARVLGAGSLLAKSPSANTKPTDPKQASTNAPTINWREKAEFTFARDANAANSKMQLTRAHFLGAVDASTSGATVRANELVTQFVTVSRRDAANKQTTTTLPSQSQAIGQATVTDAANALFAADIITVKFAPSADSSNAIPTTFVGSGMASAKIPHTAKPATNISQPTEPVFDHLTAREISGSFRSVPRDQNTPPNNTSPPASAIELATLNATGTPIEPVNFQSHDNVRATSLTLAANVPEQQVTLDGNTQHPATLTRDESNIAGPQIILNGLQRTAQLPQGGRMELREAAPPNEQTKPRAALIASADGPISYDESAATATLSDNVIATLEDGVQTSQLNASHVAVTFAMQAEQETPAPQRAPEANTQTLATSTPFATNAQVSSVIATGSPNTPASATITNKPQVANAPTSTYFIEAPRLTALAQQRAFDATGPGRLLAHTDTAATPAQPNSAAKFDAANAGDTLVQWQQSMSYRESESLAKATGRVRLAHRESAGSSPSLMECETLSLTLAQTKPAANTDTPQAQRETSAMGSLFSNTAFTTALAEGGVWGNLQGQEFTSVTATYDVIAGLLEARGDATTPVTIAAAPAKNSSPATSPLTAARVKITTRDGRVEVIDPGTVQTGPR